MKYLAKMIEPKNNIEESRKLFTNSDLRRLIIPLIFEQLLVMLVGVAATIMVSHAGEAAVSGVSLVDMINGLFIYIFSALATGGAVVVSQYIGQKDEKNIHTSASQLVMITTVLSVLLMLLVLIFHRPLLHLLFGKVEEEVMTASTTYLLITVFSLPFLALYNSCAALFRSMSLSRITLYISLLMNVINVIGNAIGVFALHAGVAGVAYPTLISRIFAAVMLFLLLQNKKHPVTVHIKEIFSWQSDHIRKILRVAVPNGIENGLFQLSKIILISIIAMFGTSQIAANGVANSIDYVGAIIALALGLAIVTVVGQSVGANDYEQAAYYIKKLIRITFYGSLILDLFIITLMPLILKLFSLSPETGRYVFILVVIHNLLIIMLQPYSGPLSNALRAAGDVKYTMLVAIFATVVCRVIFSLILGVWLNWGIIGVWIAMGIDWGIRAALYYRRFRSGIWKTFKIV